MLDCRTLAASKFTRRSYLPGSSGEENNPCQASSKNTSVYLSIGQAGKTRRGVALYVHGQLECMECLGVEERPSESLWVRIKGRAQAVGESATGQLTRETEQMRPSRDW